MASRKQLLPIRALENVSLEDNASVADGKRSRAKNNVALSSSSGIASPNRTQSISSAGVTNIMTSNGYHNVTSGNATITSSVPTRLYSSYSIHSLLGGSNNSTSSSSSSASSVKKFSDQAVVSNIGYHNHSQTQQYTDPSYLRAMLASPKSPESISTGAGVSGGGKSPSNSTNKKRSPPYVSPMHDAHSRSPIVAHAGVDYATRSPRATPPENHSAKFKMRCPTDHSAAAAAAAAYIPSVFPPSYYHPYISTLEALRHNSIWIPQYPWTPLTIVSNSIEEEPSSDLPLNLSKH